MSVDFGMILADLVLKDQRILMLEASLREANERIVKLEDRGTVLAMSEHELKKKLEAYENVAGPSSEVNL